MIGDSICAINILALRFFIMMLRLRLMFMLNLQNARVVLKLFFNISFTLIPAFSELMYTITCHVKPLT
jgi:hypothetical protein